MVSARLILRGDRRRRAGLDDVGAVDRESARREDAMGGVLRDDRSAGDDQRDAAARRLRG